jgi:hypothetical protein
LGLQAFILLNKLLALANELLIDLQDFIDICITVAGLFALPITPLFECLTD